MVEISWKSWDCFQETMLLLLLEIRFGSDEQQNLGSILSDED